LCAYLTVVLVVATVCLGLLGLFLRYAARRSPIADSLSEHAYTIYLVHYVFVVWLQYALLGATIPAIVKGLTVFAGALFLSWGVAVGAGRLTFLALPMRAAASKS
jgi:surface polysaccharide O-acyltransferase-like enzyme